MPRKTLPRASPPATEIQCEQVHIGTYRLTHVVMNILCYFLPCGYSVLHGQVYIVSVPAFRGPILWSHDVCEQTNPIGSCAKDQSYGDTMHVTTKLMQLQRTNPMGQCM